MHFVKTARAKWQPVPRRRRRTGPRTTVHVAVRTTVRSPHGHGSCVCGRTDHRREIARACCGPRRTYSCFAGHSGVASRLMMRNGRVRRRCGGGDRLARKTTARIKKQQTGHTHAVYRPPQQCHRSCSLSHVNHRYMA
jgi:hypothetical protein